MLRNPKIDAKEAELRQVRERHFTARTPATKAECRELDSKLRAEIRDLLRADGFPRETTEKLAAWDPYDQNASADFFDPEWMFGIRDGFDIVIGNPPYGLLNKRQNKAESIVVTPEVLSYYKTAPLYEPARGGMINIFRLFIIRSIDLLCNRGVFSEIFPLAFTADASMGNLRKHLLQNHNIAFIEAFPERDNVAKRVFEASKMSVCIMQLEREMNPGARFYVRLNSDRFVDLTAEKAWLTAATVALLDKENATIPLVTQRELNLLEKIYRQSVRVGDLGHCFTGEVDLTLGEEFITQDSRNPPLLRGAGIAKYCVLSKMSQGEFLYLNERAFLRAASAQKVAHTKTKRIVLQGITGVNERTRLRMTIVPPGTYLANSVNYLIFDCPVNLMAILGVLNSVLINFVFSKFSTNSNVNGYEVDNLPLPKAMNSQKQVPEHEAVVKLVDKILAAKRADPAADTRAWEREIDQHVYRLYGLTPEEIKIVEEGT
jgi:Alw26I/Eco31I/Esp3I family type II restriction m6 adenine DNA methyltransferase